MKGDLSNPNFWNENAFDNFQQAGMDYFYKVYMKTYCRMTPYLTGMYAALVYNNDDGTFHDRQSPLFEWIVFLVMIVIGCVD